MTDCETPNPDECPAQDGLCNTCANDLVSSEVRAMRAEGRGSLTIVDGQVLPVEER